MSMFSKLKQFKDLRDQGKKLQEALGGETVSVNSFGGKVVLTMDGNLSISGLAIDPEVMTPDNKTKLENAIKEAHAEGLKKMQRIIAGKMQEMGGFPGMGGDSE